MVSAVGIGQGSRNVSQFKPRTKAVGGTPDQLTPQHQDVPDDPIRLQDGFLSCRTCGIAVRISDEADVITISAFAEESVRVIQNPLMITQDRPRTTLRFALCPTCAQAEALAEQMSGDPATRSPWGRALLGGALDALSFLNAPLVSSSAIADFDHLSLRALVRHLGELGAQSRWASRDEVDPQLCNRYSWAHLTPGARAELRTGYALWLKERSARHAPAIKISPPPVTDNRSGSAPLILISAGCLICGVATQTMPAAEVAQHGRMSVARQIWKPLRTSATQLGSAQSAVEVSGFLSRICADALDHVHSVGPSALERSLIMALVPDLTSKLGGWNPVTLSGLVGWAALVARAHQGDSSGQPAPRPNTSAWEHLGDLSAIRTQLRRRLGG